jgi:hypothetical protein
MEMALNLARRAVPWITALVGGAAVAFLIAHAPTTLDDLSGWVFKREKFQIPWHIIEADDVQRGATIPADTHVVIHLPDMHDRIAREVLFGKRGKRARYWGYCFPENYDASIRENRKTFPGKLFISEAERKVRNDKEWRLAHRNYTVFDPPTQQELDADTQRLIPSGKIRHEIEFFDPFILCYMQTDTPLPIGTDEDDDKLNSKLEQDYGTDPNSPDTDGDAIMDGVEAFNGTDPLRRDTDGDGLIDGLEDKNWNGRIDLGETNPRERDSDHDELCDGLCVYVLANRAETLLGEDENLNGQVDAHEFDPTKRSTRGDGVLDFQAYMQCRLGNKEMCP